MTRVKENQQWRCNGCNQVLIEPVLLTAPSPFDPNDTIVGCPNCKQCDEGFDPVCDEDGCLSYAGCGWPTGDNDDKFGGYRITCFAHSNFKKEPSHE